MPALHYLVFGDLHGKVLPAFRLAAAWSREHDIPLSGLLQVGDLVAAPSAEAEAVFAEPHCPAGMWFTAGNHEDFELLKKLQRRAGRAADTLAVDAHDKVHCICNGHVTELPGGLRVGALWGIGDRVRRRVSPGGRITRRATAALSGGRFDVLLSHESPIDAVHADSGSEEVGAIIRAARPAFAFFGHYHPTGRPIKGDFGATRVYHLSHLELRSRAEEGSVGVLTWDGATGAFAYLDPAWLRTVTRHNWKHR